MAETMIDQILLTVDDKLRYSTPNLNKHATATSLAICQECAHMKRDMIMRYDFAPFEHSDQYL